MTEGYSLREVGKLLGLSRSIIGRLIDAGFVLPTRGRRREYRFTFRDLVLLRAAQGLTEAKIPSVRILRSLRRLRAQLPQEVPLAGLRIEAVGDAVVVSEGQSPQWRPDDGQYVMQFQVGFPDGRLAFFGPAEARTVEADESWFEQGVALERTDPEQACQAYRRGLRADATHRGAYVNLGRLLHERNHMEDAEAVYRQGLAACGADGTLLFNLGILLEDLQRPDDAAGAYRAALDVAPDMADAHFNLARLCEARGMQQDAVRHFSAFRKLTGKR